MKIITESVIGSDPYNRDTQWVGQDGHTDRSYDKNDLLAPAGQMQVRCRKNDGDHSNQVIHSAARLGYFEGHIRQLDVYTIMIGRNPNQF